MILQVHSVKSWIPVRRNDSGGENIIYENALQSLIRAHKVLSIWAV